ncbi:MAG: S24 family peptidase [Actinomycetota bacterium]|nr:S24 family peptidase [Actinomycetota bacterium]
MKISFLREVFAWIIGRRRRFRVQGNSMEPVISDRDVILLAPDGRFEIGDIVVGRHPFKKTHVIKYVTVIAPDDYIELRSPEGTDSRQFGRTHSSQIIGRATINLSKRTKLSSAETEISNKVVEEH